MAEHGRHYLANAQHYPGKWGPPTSSANFCEEDYDITRYIAEFMNSLTNLTYVYYGLRYMYGPGSQGLFAPRVDFMSISLLVLGVGSTLFHATNRMAMQFADELAMLVLAWAIYHAMWTTTPAPTSKSGQHAREARREQLIKVFMAIFFPAFSVFYVYTGKLVYHYTVFFVLVVLIIARGHYLFTMREPAFPEAKRKDWRTRGLRALYVIILGYVLWNIDIEFCSQLRALRAQIGYPWAWLLELHGWWHIFTGMSAAWYMDILREVQDEIRAEKRD